MEIHYANHVSVVHTSVLTCLLSVWQCCRTCWLYFQRSSSWEAAKLLLISFKHQNVLTAKCEIKKNMAGCLARLGLNDAFFTNSCEQLQDYKSIMKHNKIVLKALVDKFISIEAENEKHDKQKRELWVKGVGGRGEDAWESHTCARMVSPLVLEVMTTGIVIAMESLSPPLGTVSWGITWTVTWLAIEGHMTSNGRSHD